MKRNVLYIALILAVALVAAGTVLPPNPDDFCDGHGGIMDYHIEVIMVWHGGLVTTGWIACSDGISIDW